VQLQLEMFALPFSCFVPYAVIRALVIDVRLGVQEANKVRLGHGRAPVSVRSIMRELWLDHLFSRCFIGVMALAVAKGLS
jgi:hypothetical protein